MINEMNVALLHPVAEKTLEVQIPLAGTIEASQVVDLGFPARGKIVAFVIIVTRVGAAVQGLEDASLDDVMLSIQPSPQGGRAGLTRRGENNVTNNLFVTARALDSTRRLFQLDLGGGENWQLQARWKDWAAGYLAAPRFHDSTISICPIYDIAESGKN